MITASKLWLSHPWELLGEIWLSMKSPLPRGAWDKKAARSKLWSQGRAGWYVSDSECLSESQSPLEGSH